jgi:hypothetical protein
MTLRKELGIISRIQGHDIFGYNENRETYTFHKGGNKELQFNFGEDSKWINGKTVFRYGIAFSIERNPHFFNPQEVLFPKVKVFNNFLSVNPKYFENWLMFIDGSNTRSEYLCCNEVKKINIDKVFDNTFIFIGRYFDKTKDEITDLDIEVMLKAFDYLIEVYKTVESGGKNESRVARICWNTNGWIKPSGREGKSKGESFEKNYGYGHEEWIFDSAKNYNGYHYGFLQPIGRNYDRYVGQKFNLHLYTIDSTTKTKYWVGKLNEVEVIDKKLSQKVFNYYKSKGWLLEYKNHLMKLQLWADHAAETFKKPISQFNIRFKPTAIKELYDPLLPFEDQGLFEKPRYIFNYLPSQLKANELIESGFDPDTGSSSVSSPNRGKSYRTIHSDIEIPTKHRDLLNGFMKYLKEKYKNQVIKKESKAFGNNKIDLFRKTDEGYIFYEIKSYTNLKTCLRVALGQLLEYNCFPDVKNANKMYLVSDLSPNLIVIKYIKHLNTIINIPFGYIQFDLAKKKVITEI